MLNIKQTLLIADVTKIPYKPQAGAGETMVYKHYNASEVSVRKYFLDLNYCSDIRVLNVFTVVPMSS